MSTQRAARKTKSPRVLVVGAGLLAFSMGEYLAEHGFERMWSVTEDQGISLLKRKEAGLVVYEMSAMDRAVRFIREVKAIRNGAKIIALSMKDDPEYAAYMFSMGISAYVWEGDVDREFMDALRVVRKKSGQYLSSHIRSRL
jgi:DNA-binding NarL/FixJ family response regulator